MVICHAGPACPTRPISRLPNMDWAIVAIFGVFSTATLTIVQWGRSAK
jgi:hypothetical protein